MCLREGLQLWGPMGWLAVGRGGGRRGQQSFCGCSLCALLHWRSAHLPPWLSGNWLLHVAALLLELSGLDG